MKANEIKSYMIDITPEEEAVIKDKLTCTESIKCPKESLLRRIERGFDCLGVGDMKAENILMAFKLTVDKLPARSLVVVDLDMGG